MNDLEEKLKIKSKEFDELNKKLYDLNIKNDEFDKLINTLKEKF